MAHSVTPQPEEAHSPARRATALAIPTRDEIRTAVDALPLTSATRGWVTGKRVFLEGAAGYIRIYSRLSPGSDGKEHWNVGTSKAALADVAQAQRDWLNRPMALADDPTFAGSYPRPGIDPTAVLDSPEFASAFDQLAAENPPTRRGMITSWSAKSIARMNRTMGVFDYTPLFLDGRLPALVTLTMPGEADLVDGGELWQWCAPTPRDFKKMVNRLRLEYTRAWGAAPVGVWKMEFQRRGAPHLHILMLPPTGLSAGRYLHDRSGEIVGRLRWKTDEAGELVDELVSMRTGGLMFADWLALTWAKIVGVHKMPAELFDHGGSAQVEFRKHVNAGMFAVSRDSIERYADPKRIAAYFTKHSSFSAKAYQNQMPQVWVDAVKAGAPSGQFWGAWGLERTHAARELAQVAPAGEKRRGRLYHPSRRYDSIMSSEQVENPVGDALAVAEHLASLPLVIAQRATDWQAEDQASWATDASVGRQFARDQSAAAGEVSEQVRIERHLRKLARAQAVTRRAVTLIGPDGSRRVVRFVQERWHIREVEQLCGDGVRRAFQVKVSAGARKRVRKVLGPAQHVDARTGEVTTVKKRRSVIGFYQGGSGFLIVNDGRTTLDSCRRVLGGNPDVYGLGGIGRGAFGLAA